MAAGAILQTGRNALALTGAQVSAVSIEHTTTLTGVGVAIYTETKAGPSTRDFIASATPRRRILGMARVSSRSNLRH